MNGEELQLTTEIADFMRTRHFGKYRGLVSDISDPENLCRIKAKVPAELTKRAAEVVGWNERLIIDAVRRQARHEDTVRWDTIEFKL